MERIITVYNTQDQKQTTFNSTAETVAELKRGFEVNNINYQDLDMIEGITKTKLLTDDTILPHNINYRGTITNDLIIYLTNSNKKIRSGAPTRQQLYAELTPAMKDYIKETYGKNFTKVPSDVLAGVIYEATGKAFGADNEEEKEEENNKDSLSDMSPESRITLAVVKLANMLYDRDILTTSEFDDIERTLGINIIDEESLKSTEPKVKSPYSETEINDIMEDLGI